MNKHTTITEKLVKQSLIDSGYAVKRNTSPGAPDFTIKSAKNIKFKVEVKANIFTRAQIERLISTGRTIPLVLAVVSRHKEVRVIHYFMLQDSVDACPQLLSVKKPDNATKKIISKISILERKKNEKTAEVEELSRKSNYISTMIKLGEERIREIEKQLPPHPPIFTPDGRIWRRTE